MMERYYKVLRKNQLYESTLIEMNKRLVINFRSRTRLKMTSRLSSKISLRQQLRRYFDKLLNNVRRLLSLNYGHCWGDHLYETINS